MKHIYESIPGWFSFPKLYTAMVNKFPYGSLFVEVGTYYGCSFSYLVVEVINSGKKIDCVAVDACPWPDVEPNFNENMKPLHGHFRTMFGGDSFDRAKDFEDGSIDFLFLDANHTYDFISKDIKAYLPKMKPGGVIAGHDYGRDDYRPYPDIQKAVGEIFGGNTKTLILHNEIEDTWQVQL